MKTPRSKLEANLLAGIFDKRGNLFIPTGFNTQEPAHRFAGEIHGG
jgi:hypothetical protein